MANDTQNIKAQIGVMMDQIMRTAIENLAEGEDRTLSNYCVRILKEDPAIKAEMERLSSQQAVTV